MISKIKTILYILLLNTTFLSFSQNNLDSILQKPENNERYTKLNSAFLDKKTDLKKSFLTEWFEISRNLENNFESYNDTLKAIQQFFSAIFIPDLDTQKHYFQKQIFSDNNIVDKKIIQWSACFVKAEYFILKPYVKYAICPDTLINKLFNCNYSQVPIFTYNTITCYFPDIKFQDKKKLYITQDYRAILDKFLLEPVKENYSYFYKSEDRRIFLSPEIELSKSHDGWFYHYEIFPLISKIYFNESFNIAVVEFASSFNTSGYAKFKFNCGSWILYEYKRVFWVM
jgi:hypothetical protein